MSKEVTTNISIAIEANMHTSIKSAIQNMCEAYNVQIEKVDVTWEDPEVMQFDRPKIKQVRIVSTSL